MLDDLKKITRDLHDLELEVQNISEQRHKLMKEQNRLREVIIEDRELLRKVIQQAVSEGLSTKQISIVIGKSYGVTYNMINAR